MFLSEYFFPYFQTEQPCFTILIIIFLAKLKLSTLSVIAIGDIRDTPRKDNGLLEII